MMIFYFFYDVLDVIVTSSLQFQKRYGLLVDQCKNIEDMTSSLRKIGSLCGGHYVSEFLKSCTCGADKCNNLLTYEKTEEVVSNGVTSIEQGRHSQIPDLSDVAHQLTSKLLEELNSYIPQSSVESFDVLNPFNWPKDTYPFDGQLQFRESDLKASYNAVYMEEDPYELSVGSEELVEDWRSMLRKITTDSKWCKMIASKDILVFWEHYLGTNLIPEKLKDLIRNILAIPVGSADVERAFSILTHIRDSRRSQLTAEHIEDALRIRMNGPSPDEFNSIKYATSWVNSGKMRSDDPNRVQPKRQRILNEKGEEIAEMEFKYMGGSALF